MTRVEGKHAIAALLGSITATLCYSKSVEMLGVQYSLRYIKMELYPLVLKSLLFQQHPIVTVLPQIWRNSALCLIHIFIQQRQS